MATNQENASQSQQFPGFETFAKLTTEHIERVTAWASELAELEATTVAQTRELFEYSTTLAAQWRRMTLATAKKAADMWAGA